MTVIASYIWANCFFMSTLAICGPKGIPNANGGMDLQFSLGSWNNILGGKKSVKVDPQS